MEFLIRELPNYNEIIQSIDKKYSPTFGIYFILRVDGTHLLFTLLVILLICNKLPITNEIKWTKCNTTRSNRYYKKSTAVDPFKNSLPSDFFSNYLNPKAPCFNLCASWNINGWNTEKKDGVLYFISTFKPVCLGSTLGTVSLRVMVVVVVVVIYLLVNGMIV